MKRIFYLVQKEFRQIARDKAMIGILFVVPLIQIFILGNAVTTDVKNVTVAIHDRDRSMLSRELIQSVAHAGTFTIVTVEDDYTKLRSLLDNRTCNLALVIPDNFQRDVVRRSKPSIQVIADGLDGNSIGVALGHLSEIVRLHQAGLIAGDPLLARALAGFHLVETEPRFWYNPNLESRVYIVPGIIALILVIITVFLTGMALVREKEIGTMEQLMVTPIRSLQLIIGKVIPFSILAFVEINIAIFFVWLIFGIGIEGSYLLLLIESALFILTTLGLGIFISTISETQQQALFVAWFFMIFAILLSGFFIPIANMPDVIQYLTYLNPLRYFLVILREIYLKATPITELWQETLAMIVFGTVVFSGAVLRYRRVLV